MSEQRHQCLHTHPRVGEFGGPGMTQLMRRDDEDAAAGSAQPSGLGRG